MKVNIGVFARPMLGLLQEKIEEAVSKGICREVNAANLMLDIVSLNVFPYMSSLLVNAVLNGCMDDQERFLEQRKKRITTP